MHRAGACRQPLGQRSCQGSLPNFEGALRKRPLAVSNEGTGSAFISCSMAADIGSPSGVTGVLALFTNRTGSPVTINCTMVSGVAAPFGSPLYFPKSASIPANSYTIMQWSSSADNGGSAFMLPNLNCSIPPGTEFNVVQTDFT